MKYNLKSRLFALLLQTVFLIVFFTLIRPSYRMIVNINNIRKPEIGDIYIINSTKFNRTKYSPSGQKEKKEFFENTFYRLLMIDKIEKNNLYFKFSSFETNSLNSVKNWIPNDIKKEDFFRSDKWIIVPANKLSSLNYRFMIISITKQTE